jgi:hypothetical protein
MKRAAGLDSPDIAPELNKPACAVRTENRSAEAKALFKRARTFDLSTRS